METLDAVKSDYELEHGKPMPSKLHGRLQARLVGLLYANYEQSHTIYSELSLVLPPLFNRQVPDVAVYNGATPFSLTDEITVSEPPTLAVEILSPTQALSELTDKVEAYLAAGVRSCWIVLPGVRVVFLSTQPGSYTTFNQHDTLRDPATGIELELARLFG